MPDRPPSEHDVDRLLRDAGARLRATAPTTVAPTVTRRRRWIVPLTIGTVAAASITIMVAITARPDEALEQLPVDTGPVVTDAAPVPTVDTVPTMTTAPPPDGTVTTTTIEQFSVVVDDVGWDGPGSACLTLDALDVPVAGCFPGGTISDDAAAPTTAWVFTGGGSGSFDVSIIDGAVSAARATEGVPCPGDLPYRTDAWLIGLVCSRGAALWEALPDTPTGPPAPEAVRGTDGGAIERSRTPIGLQRVPGAGWRIYTADLDLGFEARCTLIVPDPTGWYETCDVSQPVHPGTLLVSHDGEPFLVDPTDGRVVALGEAALRTNGCDTSIRGVVGTLADPFDGAIVRAIACDGDVGTGVVGAVWLQSGPPDGSLVVWQRGADGTWRTTDYGTGIEPAVEALPLPPVDVALAELDVAAVGFTDVTEAVRGWMDADPSLPIPDAIAAGVPDVLGVERFDTLAMTAIPSLTFVEVAYPDDSIGSGRYAVWTTEPDDGGDPLLVAWRWDLCTRGATPDGVCV
jgi:hypothetical protein